MDSQTLIVSGLCALAGGAAGWLTGAILGAVISSARKPLTLLGAMVGIAAGVAILPPFAGPLLEPVFGHDAGSAPGSVTVVPPKTKSAYSKAQIEEAVDQALRNLGDPFLQAVLEREPDKAESLRARLYTAYENGGQSKMVEELQAADQRILASAFPHYMVRATDEALIETIQEMRGILVALSDTDSETCYKWLFGQSIGQDFEFDRYIAAIGEDRHQQFQNQLAEVVRSAGRIVPAYDSEVADLALFDIGQQMIVELGDEKVGLITSGQVPEGEDDYRLACRAAIRFYDLILEKPNSADLLRHRFLTSL